MMKEIMLNQNNSDNSESIQSPPTKIAKKIYTYLGVAICFTLSIVACGLGIHNYKKNHLIVDDNDKLQQMLDLAVVDTKLLENDFNQLKKILTSSYEEIKAQQIIINELTQINKNPSLQFKLLNIANLINLADVKLKTIADIQGAEDILEIAEKYLANEHNQDIINIRQDLLKYKEQLSKIKTPDLVKIGSSLREFGDQINKLDSLDLLGEKNNVNAPVVAEEVVTESTKKSSAWKSALKIIKQDLLNLVSIHKLNEQHAAKLTHLLNAEQLNSLKLYFKLKIAEALLSLQQQDIENFNKILKILESDIQVYFVNNDQLKSDLLKILQSTKNLQQTVELPNLGDLYTAIRKMSQ